MVISDRWCVLFFVAAFAIAIAAALFGGVSIQ